MTCDSSRKVGTGSIIVMGYGYRSAGEVVRPIITFQNSLEVDLTHLTLVTADFVSTCVFDVELEGDLIDMTVEFKSILESDAHIPKLTGDGPTGDW